MVTRMSTAVVVLSAVLAVAGGGAVIIEATAVTASPIIGVLTMPMDQCISLEKTDTASLVVETSGSCMNALYVKFIESGGGRVVPVPYDASRDDLDILFASLNGMLFTGGELSLDTNTTYFQTAQYLFDRTVRANNAGDPFVLWGTCMGFQLLSVLAAGTHDVLEHNAFDSEHLSMALHLTPAAAGSRLLGAAGPITERVAGMLTRENVTSNLHHDGVTPEAFRANARLGAFFDVLSTNVDRRGKAFVSTIEGRGGASVFGTQWHPERPQFDWSPGEGINHGADAVEAMQYIARFLVGEARKNSHHFRSPAEEHKHLIWNYAPRLVGAAEQMYYFPF